MKLTEQIQKIMTSPPRIYNIDGSEFKNTKATYQKIKNYLISNVMNENAIGIVLKKDPHYFLSILACMELGITYVPMKDDFPKARIDEITEDAGINFLLTSEIIKSITEGDCLSLAGLNTIKKQITDELPLYILFTSGSTGRPKGVVINRKAFMALDLVQDKFLDHVPVGSNLLQVTEFTFDISLVDFLLFLRKKVNIYFSDFASNVYRLAFEIEEYKINFLCTVPNNMNMILNEQIVNRADYSTLKTIVIIGARITTGLHEKLGKSFSEGFVVNGYGPTEFTVYSHAKKFEFNTADDLDGVNVSIGAPLENVRSEIIKDGEIQEAYQQGELCLAGDQIMCGYKGDPEKTKNVLFDLDGEVFYKTGDIAYKDEGGEYYIVGRLDDTIKYRGYRINLLDINSYISKLEYVDDVVTIAIPDEIRENLTISFVILNDVNILEEKLRSDLADLILDYQIPEKIHFLKSYPTNTSGKVSKKDLIKLYNEME